jgi:hypothetical protein
MRTGRKLLGVLAGLSLVASSAGCVAAVAAGAGAGAAVAHGERGVEAKMARSVDDVFTRAQTVFGEMGITETGQDNDGDRERELKGRRGDLEITVDIQDVGDGTSSVNVYAQRSTVDWDRDYARVILRRITRTR